MIVTIKILLQKLLHQLSGIILRQPALRQTIINWSRKLGIYSWLQLIYFKVNGKYQRSFTLTLNQDPQSQSLVMSLRAQQIYLELKQLLNPRHQD